MSAIVFGLFGLIVGSFLNVVVLRHGVRSIGGRSGCMSCGAQLRWYDMLPVVSWLALGGRCRACRARISPQYPFVEATTAILFGFIGASSLSILPQVISCLILALLVAISVYDLRHTIIPDEWAYAFAGLAFVSQFLLPLSGEFNPWWFVFAGPVVAAPLFALWLFSGGRWMGLGDAKLALGIGWLLGPVLGIFAVFGAFVVGAIVSVGILLPLPRIVRALYTLGITSADIGAGGFTMKSEIPFGPFLIFSCIIIWFATLYGIDPLEVFGLLPLTTF
ncbi:hypothetical protein A3C18_00560 [Candidatus Kaiserbacteria bacterium RIFCSPHIGHO2_02_FULL_54_11b]|uniref:Peptidase A24A N-terminal domain-containing protein n=2 Tax=Candidatus Kaiseribacteriota TaxID=1752734 RepID=A0A1F6CMF0_9BACT|nr:MAG: hypothetical protein A2704_05735 [Candidatus Kaiserbacteria bacterium RIFCSPHIGHO2_01_FULL_54_36b]OGG65066.1 MAG: hypothetical protein A3C18_00560 [Candidatus Kaiserbacteria bacterium RIFCSPHIGHO2_02_FULL_54_11b]